ncbi:hypothetical protein V493_01766 [Pseudogymnoascus sp. VKM F-4281 (FW-2241)]|nr:hypothetical protein V493_01766 [Pseudogymnoascus sp. VKM F-4281 (FW-2241)]
MSYITGHATQTYSTPIPSKARNSLPPTEPGAVSPAPPAPHPVSSGLIRVRLSRNNRRTSRRHWLRSACTCLFNSTIFEHCLSPVSQLSVVAPSSEVEMSGPVSWMSSPLSKDVARPTQRVVPGGKGKGTRLLTAYRLLTEDGRSGVPDPDPVIRWTGLDTAAAIHTPLAYAPWTSLELAHVSKHRLGIGHHPRLYSAVAGGDEEKSRSFLVTSCRIAPSVVGMAWDGHRISAVGHRSSLGSN